MLKRAEARKLLVVHKAASGSFRHSDEAATAVAQAAQCLDRHHGSASALMPESWRDLALRRGRELDQSWSQGGQQQQQQQNWQGKGKGLAKGKGQEASAKGKGKDSGKGKGKDAGKSKGKGKGTCWPCPDKRCAVIMGKVWMNAETLCQCGQCGTWRETRKAPDTDWLARRAELRETIVAEGGTDAPLGEDEAMGDSEEEETEEEDSIIVLTEEFVNLEGRLMLPNELKPGWDPAMAIDAGPGQAASQRDKEIETCKKYLALEPMAAALGQGKEHFATTRTKLAALEKAAVKAQKDAPGAKLTACQLATALQNYEDVEEKKVKFALAGEVHAEERQDRMEAICAEQAAAWMDKLRSIEKQKLVRVAAWGARKAELEARKTQVVELFGRKIKAAQELATALKEAKPAEVKPAVSASPAETPDQKKEREKEEKVEKERAAKVAKEEVDRLAAVQAEIDRQAAAQTEARRAFGRMQTTAAVDKDDLVDMSQWSSSDESKTVMACMYYWARASSMGDAQFPFAFKEMGATVAVAQELVGNKVWKAFFKDSTVTDGDVCPMQLRQIMFLQLMTLDADLREKGNAGQEAVAVKHLEDAEPRLKRLRTMLNPP